MKDKSEETVSELETFLPNSDNCDSDKNNLKISVVPIKNEIVEINSKPYNPFNERKIANPTTDSETMVHLLKASLGTGLLSMPYAFSCSGLTTSLIGTMVTAFVCTYCSYILVKCAHFLYYKVRVHSMSYADVAEVAFANGPLTVRKFSKAARLSIMWGIFITYFSAISCYTLIVGSSFQEVIEYYTKFHLDVRIYIISLLPPLILLSLVPNLKALTPVSMTANVFILLGLGITIYYLVFDMHKPWDLKQIPTSLSGLPKTCCITVFAMEAIGLMMPLENNMKNPPHFLGLCGVLNKGMSVVSMIYILIGFIGYLKYGDNVKDNITASLPITDIAAQFAKVFIGLSVLLTYALQYFVVLDIAWSAVKDNCIKRAKVYNTLLRVMLATATVLLAVIVPDIGAFVSIIGAFCFSILGIIFPVLIDIMTYWNSKPAYKLILRNLFMLIFGFVILFVGTYNSLIDIFNIYFKPSADTRNDTLLYNSTVINSVSQ